MLCSLSRKQIKVCVTDPKSGFTAVRVCDGVIRADAALDGGPPFVEDSFVPNGRWRAVTQDEAHDLFCRRSLGIHRTVGLARIVSTEVAHEMRAHTFELHKFEGDHRACEEPVLSQILRSAKRVVRIDGPVMYNGVAKNKPGLVAVTYDRSRSARIGLHVDNWEHTNLDNADFVPNRISINLGPDDRFFLFVNLTLREIQRNLGEQVRPLISKADLVRAFFEQYPNYPVIRVKLKPGEAYIAPTENIIHDGSSVEARDQNSHLTFRGRFTMLEPELRAVGATNIGAEVMPNG
jgi:hypothetical protein